MSTLPALLDALGLSGTQFPAVRVVVAEARGSTPRDAGAAMIVTRDGTTGTVGGGQLEWQAIAEARALLAEPAAPWLRRLLTFPLGPSLGQCCGGTTRLLLERIGESEVEALSRMDACGDAIVRPIESGAAPVVVRAGAAGVVLRDGMLTERLPKTRPSLFLYGAGHVGRAIVAAIVPLEMGVTWIDIATERFPQPVPSHVTPAVAAEPALLARHAPAGAYHLVLTHSHALDLAICHAVLAAGTHGFLGLIGSDTKRARFESRLRQSGIPETALARLTCPIGIAGIRSKAPGMIAIAVAAQLAQLIEAADIAANSRGMTRNEREGHARRLSA